MTLNLGFGSIRAHYEIKEPRHGTKERALGQPSTHLFRLRYRDAPRDLLPPPRLRTLGVRTGNEEAASRGTPLEEIKTQFWAAAMPGSYSRAET